MKLYVQNYSSFIQDDTNIKQELKKKYGVDTRRQDSFIHLALYGAQLLKEKINIDESDELYITSGIGNENIVQKTNTYMHEENQPLKLFDFINLLGNTTSYYVAQSLGIKGKNIFQISEHFTYINTLISAYASIKYSAKNVIIGTVDLVSNPSRIMKRVMGVDESIELISSVNYQKLSLKKNNAIASIEFDIKSYSHEEIEELLPTSEFISRKNSDEVFCETIISNKINENIQQKRDVTLIESFEDKYKIIKIKILK